MPAVRYVFGDVVLDTDRYELRRDGEPVHVEPQVFAVLMVLVERRHRVVRKTELLDDVWGDRFVSESALTSRIKAARQAVGDDGTAQQVIRTVHGRGYQLIAEVTGEAGEPAPSSLPEAPSLEQEIRFCTTADGRRLAYATVGDGTAAGAGGPLDHPPRLRLAQPRVAPLARGPGPTADAGPLRRARLWAVRPRRRGVVPRRLRPRPGAVVDALDLERFPLLGMSQGGPVAMTYADRHPERVSHLVLVGTYARGRVQRARNDEERREALLHIEMARVGWGRDDPTFRRFFTSAFIPDAPAELWDAFAELIRRTTSAENAAHQIETWSRVDVTDIATPTRRADAHPPCPRRSPRALRPSPELGTLITGSRVVPLDSANHLLRADEPAWAQLLAQIDAFLAEDDA